MEELEAQPSLLSARVQQLTEEARARVKQFAASLVEPDVWMVCECDSSCERRYTLWKEPRLQSLLSRLTD